MIVTEQVIQILNREREKKYSVRYSLIFLKHLSTLSIKSRRYSVAVSSRWPAQHLRLPAAFTDCKSLHLLLSNRAVKSAFFICIQEIL